VDLAICTLGIGGLAECRTLLTIMSHSRAPFQLMFTLSLFPVRPVCKLHRADQLCHRQLYALWAHHVTTRQRIQARGRMLRIRRCLSINDNRRDLSRCQRNLQPSSHDNRSMLRVVSGTSIRSTQVSKDMGMFGSSLDQSTMV
jgi:hypothetical protein